MLETRVVIAERVNPKPEIVDIYIYIHIEHLLGCTLKSIIPNERIILDLDLGSESIFSTDHHYKRDVSKTADRIPRTACKVNNDSLLFYNELLNHEGFTFVYLFELQEKEF